MQIILKGVSHYRWNADGKEMRVSCESFEQEFSLEPPKEKEKRKPLTTAQKEKLALRQKAQDIFDHWNQVGCMKHREFGQYALFIQRKIKGEGYDNLVKAIDNFVSIFDPEQKQFYWSVKRNIKQVLSDDRWYPDNFNIDEYRVKGKENSREDDVKVLYERSGMKYWKEE